MGRVGSFPLSCYSQRMLRLSWAVTSFPFFSGLEWLSREILKEVANSAVDIAEMLEDAKKWEEWEGKEDAQTPRRSEEEEKCLWYMLKEVDKKVAREEKRAKAKKTKEVAKARKRMGVGKEQPSISDRFKAKNGVANPTTSNRTSMVPLVTLGQSNGSTSISPVKQGGIGGRMNIPD